MTKQPAKLIVVLGPTASGKSDLAMTLAQKYQGEIICADSRTIYRGMDIGTAKPSAADQELVPHHLLDVVNPDQSFSAAEFKLRAEAAITDITARGKLPMLVGGSGLYIDSILYDYQFPVEADPSQRAELERLSIFELQQKLTKINSEKYEKIDINNRRRLIRAIEITNNPNNTVTKSDIIRANTLVLGIAKPKNVLNANIIKRAELMLREGIISEVRNIGQTYGWDSEAMSGIIYRAFKDVARENSNNSEKINAALAEFIAGDKKLVKKQVTWFKRNPNIIWLDDAPGADKLVASFLAKPV